jgi:hypothetical protein
MKIKYLKKQNEIFSSLILAWRRRLAASFFKKVLPSIEPPTEEIKTEEQIEEEGEDDDDDEVDKDIDEQLLKLNEQQRKEAKRLKKNFRIY